MCGISGFIGSRDKVVIEKMLGFPSPRGPDDRGTICPDDEMHLDHTRLSIINLLEAGHRLMPN